jgi:hypothetical protein
MIPVIDDDGFRTPGVEPFGGLLCPVCKEDYLHQIGISAGMRFKEDEPGLRISIDKADDASAGVPNILVSSESTFIGRRDDVSIAFLCECGASASLDIWQHKGSTLISWSDVKKGEPTE